MNKYIYEIKNIKLLLFRLYCEDMMNILFFFSKEKFVKKLTF